LSFNWFFLKKEYFPLQADLIYHRHHHAILIYAKEMQVVKIGLTGWGKVKLQSEMDSQRCAFNIQQNKIIIPFIFKIHNQDDTMFYVQQLVEGKKLSFKNRNRL